MLTNKLRNQKGFTLIEIIAVLVILGILAAVAIPRYIDIQGEARNKAAEAAISETKARLSVAYGKTVLLSGSATPTVAQVQANGNFAAGSWGPDYVVTVGNTDPVLITVSQVQGVTVSVTGNWNLPAP